MLWLVVLGCAGGDGSGDSGEVVDGFVKLWKGDAFSSAFCAQRADGSAECFGYSASRVDGYPADQQWRFLDPGHMCGLDLEGELQCWGEWGGTLAPFDALPPGPYVEFIANQPVADAYQDFVAAVREDGRVEIVGSKSPLLPEYVADIDVRTLGEYDNWQSMQEGCVIDTSGGLSCWPEEHAEGFWQPAGEGPFEELFWEDNDEGGCVLDSDGLVDCFGTGFDDEFDWEYLESSGPFRTIELPYAVTADNQAVLVDGIWADYEGLIPEGEEQVVDVANAGVHICYIPLERPDTVDCTLTDGEYPFEVLPPGHEE